MALLTRALPPAADFALLTSWVSRRRGQQEIARLDITASRALQRLADPRARWLLAHVSDLGYQPQSALLTTAATGGLLWLRGQRRAATIAVGGSLLARGSGSLIKLAVRRARPSYPGVTVTRRHTTASFPSGHVVHYVTLFGFAAYVIRRTCPPSGERALLLAGLDGLVILVGPSRIFLGAHWLSDVLGAYLLANLWLLGMIALYRRAPRAAGSVGVGPHAHRSRRQPARATQQHAGVGPTE